MFHRDIISWTLLNNLSSKVPMENPIIQILLFFYLIYSFMPHYITDYVTDYIRGLRYGKKSMISFKFDDDKNNHSLRFMALSRYLSRNHNAEISQIQEHVAREWDHNDELHDKSFYRVSQKGAFLIDKPKDIYGNVRCSEKEQGNRHSNSTWTKTITEMDIFSTKLTVKELRDWIEDVYIEDKRKRDKKYGEHLHLFTIRWDSSNDRPVVTAKKFKSNAKFNNSWSPYQKILLKNLDFFTNNEDYYENRGWPYTLGLAFVGKPGGGKTRALKQIINHTGRHGVVIEFSDDFKLSALETIMHGQIDTDIIFDPKDIIIIFEDIDTATSIIADRKKVSNNPQVAPVQQLPEVKTNEGDKTASNTVIKVDLPQKKANGQHLGKLLNIIDGVCERHGGMIFLTSNYPDKIDDALLRPGRFDIKIEVDNLTKKEVFQYTKHFWGKECDINELQISENVDKSYTTADLTEVFRSARGNFKSIKSKLVKS
jgi:hypothetical protein